MTNKSKADMFLKNMTQVEDEPPPVVVQRKEKVPVPAKAPSGYRKGLKHIGGYFEPETTERVALLRARLGMDNSELLKLAIDELYMAQRAKRAFND